MANAQVIQLGASKRRANRGRGDPLRHGKDDQTSMVKFCYSPNECKAFSLSYRVIALGRGENVTRIGDDTVVALLMLSENCADTITARVWVDYSGRGRVEV